MIHQCYKLTLNSVSPKIKVLSMKTGLNWVSVFSSIFHRSKGFILKNADKRLKKETALDIFSSPPLSLLFREQEVFVHETVQFQNLFMMS